MNEQSALSKIMESFQESIANSPDVMIESIEENKDYWSDYNKACILLALVGIDTPTPAEVDKALSIIKGYNDISNPSSNLTISNDHGKEIRKSA